MKKILAILGGITLLSFLIWSRFYQLNLLPASLTHDETIYAANAKSYLLQGRDLTQTHNPWDISPIHPLYAEWPATVMSLGFILINNPLLATHFSSALMGVIFPFIFGWLLWGLWKNKQLTVIGIVIAATNPLIWQFSRLSYDTFYSVFFYLVGGAIFVNLKGKKAWWSLPLLIIGFFQYQGLKLLLFPWIGVLFLLKNQSLNKVRDNVLRSTGIIMITTVVVSLFYGLVVLPKQQTNNRLNSTIFSGSDIIAQQVDTDRRLSLVSHWNKYVSNKLTQNGWFMIDRFIDAFNPYLLFRYGEPSQSGFAIWTHGIFYLIDALMIILGISMLLGKKKTKLSGFLILFSLLIFSVPNVINTMSEWHIPRTFLAYTMLLIIISWGGLLAWQDKFWRWIVGGAYLISIIHFGYQYFYRYPVTHLDAGTWDERVVSTYASHISDNQLIWIYTDTPEMTFYNYLLYTNKINKNNLDKIKNTIIKNKDLTKKHYSLANVIVTNDCVELTENKVHLWKTGHSFCKDEGENDEASFARERQTQSQRLSIPAVLDSGETYRIYGDKTCNQYQLSSFVHLQHLDDLNLDKMNTQQFCQKWITDLRSL